MFRVDAFHLVASSTESFPAAEAYRAFRQPIKRRNFAAWYGSRHRGGPVAGQRQRHQTEAGGDMPEGQTLQCGARDGSPLDPVEIPGPSPQPRVQIGVHPIQADPAIAPCQVANPVNRATDGSLHLCLPSPRLLELAQSCSIADQLH
jgi:hypothetical protein